MSPEQVSRKSANVGPATDIYALGAMLYCMLTDGRHFKRRILSIRCGRYLMRSLSRHLDSIQRRLAIWNPSRCTVWKRSPNSVLKVRRHWQMNLIDSLRGGRSSRGRLDRSSAWRDGQNATGGFWIVGRSDTFGSVGNGPFTLFRRAGQSHGGPGAPSSS